MKLKSVIRGLKNGKEIEELVKIKKNFMTFAERRVICSNVANLAIFYDEDTEMYVYEDLVKDMYLTLYRIIYYTNIEIDDLFIEDENGENDINLEVAVKAYDDLMANKIYALCVENLNDFNSNDTLDNLIQSAIEQKINIYNSTGFAIKTIVNELVSKLPNPTEIQSLIGSVTSELSKKGMVNSNQQPFTNPQRKDNE